MEYTPRNAKRWSKLGERPVFGLAVLELAKKNSNILAIVSDVLSSAGLRRMKEELPEQVIDVGIAEQNMMGIASGLASEKFQVFTATFAPFQTMRCLEQIRVNLGYAQQKVIFTGLASGMAYGELGFTHCCIEDISILRAIPNITIVSPADCMEICKVIEASINWNQSIYIRLMGKTNTPIVYSEDYDFKIGRANILREGQDIAIIAAGTMVYNSLKAAEILSEQGISSTVVNMHTIKPLDTEAINNLLSHKIIVTVEEHTILGGLGSAVGEYLAPKLNKPPQLLIGINDEFPHAGSYEYLLENCGLTAPKIAEKILSAIS